MEYEALLIDVEHGRIDIHAYRDPCTSVGDGAFNSDYLLDVFYWNELAISNNNAHRDAPHFSPQGKLEDQGTPLGGANAVWRGRTARYQCVGAMPIVV